MWMPRKYSAIALDVGRASVTACQVVRDRRTIVLRNWIAIEDPLRERPGEDTLGAAPAARTARLVRQSGFKGRHVILALKPPEVNFLSVKLPEAVLSSSREQILSGLRFEAARELQCDPKTLVVDGWPLPAGTRSGENYMIAAVLRDAVREYLIRRKRDSIARQYQRAYGDSDDVENELSGWEDSGEWPKE